MDDAFIRTSLEKNSTFFKSTIVRCISFVSGVKKGADGATCPPVPKAGVNMDPCFNKRKEVWKCFI